MERNVGQILSNQLSELEERFREIATENATKRLALVVLRLVTNVGRKVGTGIEISLSRDELAQMGIVIPGRGSITVCNLPSLELEISS
jgi:hypothetical protein